MPKWHRHPSMPSRSSTVERGILEDRGAADERPDDACLLDRARAAIEEVAVEDRDIGELADLERAGLVIEVVHVGGSVGKRGQRVEELEPLLRQEHRPITCVSDRRLAL